MGRDRGRGKGGGRGRGGGGKMYIANVEELQMRESRMKSNSESEEEESEEETVEAAKQDEGDDADDKMAAMRARLEQIRLDRAANAGGNGAGRGGGAQPTIKQAAPKPVKEKPKPLVAAPSEVTSVFTSVKKAAETEPSQSGDNVDGLTRKQKEAFEAQRKKDDYQRRHNAGETAEAKIQLAKLAEVRARRAAAEKKRLEDLANAPVDQGRITADSDSESDSSDSESDSSDDEKLPLKKEKGKGKDDKSGDKAAKAAAKALAALPKLKNIDIKKMSGDQLKEHLKERSQSTQGQKKDLIKRLSDYEASR